MKKKFFIVLVFIFLILALTIWFVGKNHDFTLEINPKIDQFDAEHIKNQLLDDLDIDEKKLYFTSWWGGGFSLHLLPDGTIDWIMWEMAEEKENRKYDVYQANGSKKQINVNKIEEEVTEVDKQGSFFNLLGVLEYAPWHSIFDILPQADKYSIDFLKVIRRNEELDRYQNATVYMVKHGIIQKVKSDRLTIDSLTFVMSVGALHKASDNSYSGKSNIIFLMDMQKVQ
jgi:hypothetical protein